MRGFEGFEVVDLSLACWRSVCSDDDPIAVWVGALFDDFDGTGWSEALAFEASQSGHLVAAPRAVFITLHEYGF